MMKANWIAATLATLALGMGVVACDVDVKDKGAMPSVDVDADSGQLPKIEVTEEGRMPDVDVDVEPGRMPDIDVDMPKVVVGTTTATVNVPDVDVDMEEREMQIPTIGVIPGDASAE